MPRYYVNVRPGQLSVLVSNPDQAEEHAACCAEQCLADDALNGTPVRGMIIVADENWGRLFCLV